MDAAALQGRALGRLVDDLQALLDAGEDSSASLRALSAPREAGLCTDHGAGIVATPRIVALADKLPSYAETLPTILSLVQELRPAWLRIVLARLREIGERGDLATLCEA